MTGNSSGQDNNKDTARKAILASIHHSLLASEPFDHEHREHHAAYEGVPWNSVLDAMTTDELVESFCANLTAVGGFCTVVRSEGEAAEQLATLIESMAAKKVAISDSVIVRRLVRPVDGVKIIEDAPADCLFGCDLGITGAQWAIAETGTLVLESDAESHRLTSLVPPVHLCVLRADLIRQTLSEILELASPAANRLITFITGASRTSDIELTLAIGVHGPKALHVIVINHG